jgi:drug/metabolite transporter (DMT)-like permease
MTVQKWYLLLPLAAAALYAVAALCLRAASLRGAATLRSAMVANLMLAAGVSVFTDFSTLARIGEVWWMVLGLGASFVIAQFFGLLALSVGDASIATPVISTKVVLVAFLLAAVVGEPVPAHVWVASGLALAGVFCLRAGDAGRHRRLPLTILWSALAAAGFAGFDVMNQAFSQDVGFGRVVPPALWFSALMSAALLAAGRRGRAPVPVTARGPLRLGALLMTAQALLIIAVIGLVGDAAANNVVYASRGVWSVAAAAVFGNALGVRELDVPRNVLLGRIAGAMLILTGIALVFQ